MKRSPSQHISRRIARLQIACLCVAFLLIAAAASIPARAGAQNEKSNAKPSSTSSSGTSATAGKGAATPADDAPPGNVANGKKLFMSDGCFECHGTVGQGSTQTGGARIGPPSISYEAVVQYVRHPVGQMPPYTSKVISDQELADIYAYLKSQPQPPPAKNIPLLNQ